MVDSTPMIRQKACPKSKKKFFVDSPEIEVAVVPPAQAANAPVSTHDIDIDMAMAEIFAENQPIVVADSSENIGEYIFFG